MKNPKVLNPFSFRDCPVHFAPHSDVCITERAGYVSPQVQIEAMINAGRRLDQSRQSIYDFPDGKITDEYDVTRSPNFDLADATQLELDAQARLREQRLKQKSDALLKASQTAQEGSEDVSDTKVGGNEPSPK